MARRKRKDIIANLRRLSAGKPVRRCRICNKPITNKNRYFCPECHAELPSDEPLPVVHISWAKKDELELELSLASLEPI